MRGAHRERECCRTDENRARCRVVEIPAVIPDTNHLMMGHPSAGFARAASGKLGPFTSKRSADASSAAGSA